MATNMYHLSPAAFQLHLFNETIKSMPKLRFPAKGLVGQIYMLKKHYLNSNGAMDLRDFLRVATSTPLMEVSIQTTARSFFVWFLGRYISSRSIIGPDLGHG